MEECLEHEIRKAQTENVVAVFFVIEKTYDMMWTDGLLNKLRPNALMEQLFKWKIS